MLERIRELFEFLELKFRRPELSMAGRQNKNWRPTIITDDDRRQLNDGGSGTAG